MKRIGPRHYAEAVEKPPKTHIYICDNHSMPIEWEIYEDEEPICKREDCNAYMRPKNPEKIGQRRTMKAEIDHKYADKIWNYIKDKSESNGNFILNQREAQRELEIHNRPWQTVINAFEDNNLLWTNGHGPKGTEIQILAEWEGH